MKASLVSHYGKKPDKLTSYLSRLQDILSVSLSAAFAPYTAEQIHASIIGFEALSAKISKASDTSEILMQVSDQVNLTNILTFLRSSALPSFEVQIGGYSQSRSYGFLSQGQHPSVRSFSIQHDIAVAMGWSVVGVNVIDDFRRSFNQFNIRHKWHRTDKDIDNDFYFVLGKINRETVDVKKVMEVEQKVKKFMTESDPLTLKVNAKTLAIACYENRELPRDSTVVYAITDNSFTADDFLGCVS